MNHQPEPLTYAQLVSVAVGILLDLHQPGSEVSEADLDRAARMTRSMNPDVIDEQGLACLRRDLRFLVEHAWTTLNDRQNRGRFDETIRGLLR